MSDSIEIPMNSSANDVWTAMASATAVYPKAMPTLYKQIKATKGDGFTVGSVRTFTFGHVFEHVVASATEEITEVDRQHMFVTSKIINDGGLVPKLFDSFGSKVTVVPSSTHNHSVTRCVVKWEFEYSGSNGKANLVTVKSTIRDAFRDLDTYLSTARGSRR